MNNLNDIAEKIQAINPEFSIEVLDLLYEYIKTKHSSTLLNNIKPKELQEIITRTITPTKNFS